MTEHVHGCLNCRPDMVPAFDRDDPRWHVPEKCGTRSRPLLDGAEPGWTKGAFEGEEGWVLLAAEGFATERVHPCPTCTTPSDADPDGRYEVCVEPRFGRVAVIHDCPSWTPRH